MNGKPLSHSTHALEFRAIVPDDQPLINQIMRAGKGYWGYPEEGLDRFMNTFGINDPHYFTTARGYIAETSHGVVGYYLFKFKENVVELDYFFLKTDLIGHGYGRLLWNHCIEECRKQGWSEFTFWSDPHSLGFYEHMGAVKIAERAMVTLPGHMAPIMRYTIPPDLAPNPS